MSLAQTDIVKRDLTITRLEGTIKIDAILSEASWRNCPPANQFTTLEPAPGLPSNYQSDVRVQYDDEALYVAAQLYDNPDSILKEITLRDNIGNADWFAIAFDFYKDGLNGAWYGVTAAGVQFDTKFSANDEDWAWNMVWESAVKFNENGWAIEMKIPYSAMRFPDAEEQEWHLNFARVVRRTREESWWNEIKPEIDGYFNQFGLLKGIGNVKPPTRLFFFPYVSYYLEHFPHDEEGSSNFSRSFNGGMDIKYGISDAFTLDMTLVPDFGQVVSDNQVLNLSPFEVRFNENRQFFTEGTELFNKADIFYSRRVGGVPINFGDVEDLLQGAEKIKENPASAQLINATKVSGRTIGGLGVGVFNALTSNTYAIVEDSITGDKREILTDPLTNYNVFVLDQNLKNNSYVTLINTNVWRSGRDYDANVTGTEFRLNDKTNTWSFNGGGVLSQLYYGDSAILGNSYELRFNKISGNFQYGIEHEAIDDDYQVNDFGFNQITNVRDWEGFFSWRTFEPIGKFNRLEGSVWTEYRERYTSGDFQNFAFGYWLFAMTRGFTAFGLNGGFEPIETFDYFEPRVDGRYYAFPTNWRIGGFVSTDYRKRLAGDIEFGYRQFNEPGRYNVYYEIRPRFRINNRMFINGSFWIFKLFNDVGWAEETDDEIIFSRRDRVEKSTTLNFRYIFNPNSGITFRCRYYWSTVNIDSFHALDNEGLLQSTSFNGLNEDGINTYDENFNAFTIDMVYTWWFAPGSQMTAVWKNQIFTSDDELRLDYWDNLNYVLRSDQLNSFSIKILYFLDYNQFKKKR